MSSQNFALCTIHQSLLPGSTALSATFWDAWTLQHKLPVHTGQCHLQTAWTVFLSFDLSLSPPAVSLPYIVDGQENVTDKLQHWAITPLALNGSAQNFHT